MKITPPLAITLSIFAAASAATVWSARTGRKVWSPRVFAWRNFFKPRPVIEVQPDSPLQIAGTRFYSFAAIGSAIGSTLRLEFKNVSRKPIHSFTVSYHSPDPLDTGSFGCQPETLLQPEQSQTNGTSSRGKDAVTFSIDFVQFADGEVWYSEPPKATVKPEGVRAGARAAMNHLRKILESGGARAVLDALPRIRADVESPDFSMRETFGHFGFYCGITNTEVRVQHAFREGDLPAVEALLRQQYNSQQKQNYKPL